MKPRLPSLIRLTFASLKSAPLHYLVLQSAEGLSSVIAKLLEGHFEKNPILAFMVFFPFFCIASTVSNAFTFISVSRERRTTRPSFLQIWNSEIKEKLPRLVMASLALGTVFVLGFAALVFPAFYFMSIYLFVPQSIIENDTDTLSLAFFRSKKLSKRALSTCVVTVFGSLVLGILSFLVSESLGRWAGGVSKIPFIQTSISLGIDAFLSMAVGAIIDVWISHLYLGLETDGRLSTPVTKTY